MVILQALLEENIWVVMTLFLFVWVYGWAKGNLGSAKLGIIFALIVVYLTFYQFPELVWLTLILFLMTVLGKDFLEKVQLYHP